jgi:hypothetical protein
LAILVVVCARFALIISVSRTSYQFLFSSDPWHIIALLKTTFQLVALTVYGSQVIVGEFAPFLFHLALYFLQFPSTRFQSIA